MASVYKSGESYAIQVGKGNARVVRRIGKLSTDGALDVRFHLGQIIKANRVASNPPPATVAWLDSITADLHEKLVELGLVPKRKVVLNHGIALTIGKLFDDHLDRRPDLKPFTRMNMLQAKTRCIEFFKARRADTITARDVKDFVRHMRADGYARASIAGYVAKTRQVYPTRSITRCCSATRSRASRPAGRSIATIISSCRLRRSRRSSPTRGTCSGSC